MVHGEGTKGGKAYDTKGIDTNIRTICHHHRHPHRVSGAFLNTPVYYIVLSLLEEGAMIFLFYR